MGPWLARLATGGDAIRRPSHSSFLPASPGFPRRLRPESFLKPPPPSDAYGYARRVRLRVPLFWLFLACAGGCESEDGKASADGRAAPSDGGASDAGGPPVLFDAIEEVTSINTTEAESAARLSDDELSAIVTAGEGDLYLLRRESVDAPFGLPTSVAGANTTSTEAHGMLSADGLRIVFESDRPGGSGGRDLWSASRKDASSAFEDAAPISALNGPLDDGEPYLVGTRLYFSAMESEAGPSRIYVATASGSSFGARTVVALGDSTGDRHPVLSRDELEIFFSSTRAGGKGSAIWTARRASVSEPFGEPHVVAELDADGDDYPTWLSPDGRRLYFVSERNGSLDVFVATRR